jgi:hypothetical protein
MIMRAFWIVIVGLGCTSGQPKSELESQVTSSPHIEVEATSGVVSVDIFERRDSISLGGHTLIVHSIYLNDSVQPDEKHVFNPICISQDLVFKKDGSTVAIVSSPSKKINQKTASGDTVLMLENVITYLNAYSGTKGSVYSVEGYAGCNACSAFFNWYDLNGNLLRSRYGFESDPNAVVVGDMQDVYKKYGLSDSVLNQGPIFSQSVYLNER